MQSELPDQLRTPLGKVRLGHVGPHRLLLWEPLGMDTAHACESCIEQSLRILDATRPQHDIDTFAPAVGHHHEGQLPHQRLSVATPLSRHNNGGFIDHLVEVAGSEQKFRS